MKQEQIRFATEQDTASVRLLWELCFPSPDGFNDYLFENIYSPENNLLLLQDGRLCAMAQMLPYRLFINGKAWDATYIYGACTHPHCRRQHMMDRLLHRSFDIDRQNGKAASFLIPQEAWLFDFYQKFGYRTAFYVSEGQFSCHQSDNTDFTIRKMQKADLPAIDCLYRQAMSDFKLFVARDISYWQQQLNLFQCFGYGAFCLYHQQTIVGFAFVWQEEAGLWAQECFVPADLQQLFADLILQYSNDRVCRMTGVGFPSKSAIGCIFQYDGQSIEPGYLNLMLN